MVLEHNELMPILEEIQSKVFLANQEGTLPELLSKLGLSHLLSPTDDYGVQNNPRGDIIVIGDSSTDLNILRTIASQKGISKKRLTFYGYDEVKSVDCSKWKYSYSVAAILCGPLPHKAKGMGDNSSLIQSLKDGPTPVRDLRESSGELKISKSSFSKMLDELLENGILEPA